MADKNKELVNIRQIKQKFAFMSEHGLTVKKAEHVVAEALQKICDSVSNKK